MSESGEHKRIEDSSVHGERPMQSKPVEHDATYIALASHTNTLADHGQRITTVESKVDRAMTTANEAKAKVSAQTVRELAFAASFNRLTLVVVAMLALNFAVVVILLVKC